MASMAFGLTAEELLTKTDEELLSMAEDMSDYVEQKRFEATIMCMMNKWSREEYAADFARYMREETASTPEHAKACGEAMKRLVDLGILGPVREYET